MIALILSFSKSILCCSLHDTIWLTLKHEPRLPAIQKCPPHSIVCALSPHSSCVRVVSPKPPPSPAFWHVPTRSAVHHGNKSDIILFGRTGRWQEKKGDYDTDQSGRRIH